MAGATPLTGRVAAISAPAAAARRPGGVPSLAAARARAPLPAPTRGTSRCSDVDRVGSMLRFGGSDALGLIAAPAAARRAGSCVPARALSSGSVSVGGRRSAGAGPSRGAEALPPLAPRCAERSSSLAPRCAERSPSLAPRCATRSPAAPFVARMEPRPLAVALAPPGGRRAPAPPRSFVADPVPLPSYLWEGGEGPPAELSLRTAGASSARGLVHRYLVAVRAAMRAGTASSKTRGEVRGGGRKPYPQKGSGRARRGSQRSPLLRGGGVVFGPKPRDWSVSMNKRERRLALSTALMSAAGDARVVDRVELAEPRTKELLAGLARADSLPSSKRRVLLVVRAVDERLRLAARNVDELAVNAAHRLRIYDLLDAERVLLDRPSLQALNAAFGANGSGVVPAPVGDETEADDWDDHGDDGENKDAEEDDDLEDDQAETVEA